MFYAPHILQKQVTPELIVDIYGRAIPPGNITVYKTGIQMIFLNKQLYIDKTEDGDVYWEDVCVCRCDERDNREVKLSDGTVVVPNYRVICDGNNPDVKTGDYVRCCRANGSVRGQGKVIDTKKLNCLPYAEIYLQD